MGRWWTGYTSISAGRLGIAHSHREPWLFAATERLQPAYGYGLWKAKIPSEKMCSIAVCGGAGCELTTFATQLATVEAEILEVWQQDAAWATAAQRLQSIKGIGWVTAAWILVTTRN